MEQLKRMAVFAEVAAAGSLSGAARQLGMTPSAVSQHLRQLEAALGLALVHRSTRKLTLTEAGERYVEGCAAMVAAARSADQALERHRDEPEGELRIAAPIGFGGLLASVLAPLRNYPKLTLRLLMDDALVDVIAERVDIAVRVGTQPDSSLVARKLGTLRAQLCASPAYLAARGWPQHPRDLAHHDWLGGRPHAPSQELLQLHNGNQVAQVPVTSRASATQVTALHSLCVAGWGISIVLSDDDRRALADGRLVPVLPDWSPPDYEVFAITARRGEQPAKVRHTLALLDSYFQTLQPLPR